MRGHGYARRLRNPPPRRAHPAPHVQWIYRVTIHMLRAKRTNHHTNPAQPHTFPHKWQGLVLHCTAVTAVHCGCASEHCVRTLRWALCSGRHGKGGRMGPSHQSNERFQGGSPGLRLARRHPVGGLPDVRPQHTRRPPTAWSILHKAALYGGELGDARLARIGCAGEVGCLLGHTPAHARRWHLCGRAVRPSRE